MDEPKQAKRYDRSGMPWSDMEMWQLRKLFMDGYPLDVIASTLGRPPKPIVAKLLGWDLVINTREGLVYKKIPWADINDFDEE